MRVVTPVDSSSAPVSSRWAHSGVRPKGASRVPSSPARAGRRPERMSSWITTVKKTTKAQMFRVERKAFLMEPVKAAVRRGARNWGWGRAAVPRRSGPER